MNDPRQDPRNAATGAACGFDCRLQVLPPCKRVVRAEAGPANRLATPWTSSPMACGPA